MFKAIKEFFGIYDKTETATFTNGGLKGNTTVTVSAKASETTSVAAAAKPANKAAPKKRGPAKKPKKSVTK